jgi:hypothetical protein
MRLTDPDSTSKSQSWRARTAGNVRCRSAAGLLRPLTATFESAPAIPAPPRCFGTSATCEVRPNRSLGGCLAGASRQCPGSRPPPSVPTRPPTGATARWRQPRLVVNDLRTAPRKERPHERSASPREPGGLSAMPTSGRGDGRAPRRRSWGRGRVPLGARRSALSVAARHPPLHLKGTADARTGRRLHHLA